MDPTVNTPLEQQGVGNNLPPVNFSPPPPINNRKKMLTLYILIGITVIISVSAVFLIMFFRNEEKPTVTENRPTVVPSVVLKNTEYEQLDIELKKNESLSVEKLSASFLYEEQESIIPDCFDCATSGKVTVTKGDKSETGVFSCGGVSGVCDEEKTLLGLQVIVKKRNSEMISFTIKYPKE